MDLRVLRYFLKVVEMESISGAAEALHLSQPTLSRQLMDLERELKVQLLVRGNRKHKILLTEKGRILHRRAGELIRLSDLALNEIGDEGAVGGHVNLGIVDVPNLSLPAQLMADFRARHPGVEFEILSSSYIEVRERVENGLLDFVFSLDPFEFPGYERAALPFTHVSGLLVPKDHELARKGYAEKNDIYLYPLIIESARGPGKYLPGMMDINHEAIKVVASFNMLRDAAAVAESGLGLVLSFDYPLGEERGVVFVPFRPGVTRALNLSWKPFVARSRVSDLFLKEVLDFCARSALS